MFLAKFKPLAHGRTILFPLTGPIYLEPDAPYN